MKVVRMKVFVESNHLQFSKIIDSGIPVEAMKKINATTPSISVVLKDINFIR